MTQKAFKMGITDKIAEIEKEMSRTQKNKATNSHLGLLKAKLAKLRSELIQAATGDKGGGGEGFDVMKSGDARVAVIGFPSVGKSTLLSTITKTKSETAAYEFTTLTCVPGVIEYKGASIQLLDLPGIIEGAASGKGRGKQVIAVARTADMVLMQLDALNGPKQKMLLTKELEAVGLRLNQRPADIYFKAKKSGGPFFNSAGCKLTHLNAKLVASIMQEYKIHNYEIVVREDATVEQLLDIVEGNRIYVKALYVYNKIDNMSIEDVDTLARTPDSVVISLKMGLNLGYLVERIWETLALVRVFTKRRGEPPSFKEPLVLRGGATVENACHSVHRTLAESFNYAMVWGTSAKHKPQRVGKDHLLEDEDVICVVQKGSA